MQNCFEVSIRTEQSGVKNLGQEESKGLCGTCAHAQPITSQRGSEFSMCLLSKTDPRFPKYPRLPVIECVGYNPQNRPRNLLESA
jgi:hypothetical protein